MREMARLQTFPDDVQVTGTLAEAQRQLGNAVPSLLAEALRNVSTTMRQPV
jgi:DNA (cytosine-5)-methyltransferase 1